VESGDECDNALDDDGDGVANDGCPREGNAEGFRANCNANPPVGGQCLDALDDDGDGKTNDGCPEVGVWGRMGQPFNQAPIAPLFVSGPDTSPTFYHGVDTGSRIFKLMKTFGPMNTTATTMSASGSGTSALSDVGWFAGGSFLWPLVVGVHPDDPDFLYAVDDGTDQVKYSTDGGASWQVDQTLTDLVTVDGEVAWNDGKDTTVTSKIAFDPENPDRILVGTKGAGIIMSLDGGGDWFTVTDTFDRVPWVTDFFFDQDHDTIYVSTYGRGLWKLEDMPPVARCQDVIAPTDPGVCEADVSVDDGSFDPDGGPVALAQAPAGPYALGATSVTLTVTDGTGATDSCEATITVEDVEPPAVTCFASSDLLRPSNHELVDVGLELSAVDNCDATTSPPAFGIFADEDDDEGNVSGFHSPDAKVDPTLRLRSERVGGLDGRVYLSVATAVDEAGNTSHGCCTVVVPHGKSRKAIRSVLLQADAAQTFCAENGGAPPPDFVTVGDGPVIGPKQ
jgi:hypothetical protein